MLIERRTSKTTRGSAEKTKLGRIVIKCFGPIFGPVTYIPALENAETRRLHQAKPPFSGPGYQQVARR